MGTITAIVDKLFGPERLSYRSLTVFAVGTGLLWTDKLTSTEWVSLAIAFVAGETAFKMLGNRASA